MRSFFLVKEVVVAVCVCVCVYDPHLPAVKDLVACIFNTAFVFILFFKFSFSTPDFWMIIKNDPTLCRFATVKYNIKLVKSFQPVNQFS
jgi:hypothetical protein